MRFKEISYIEAFELNEIIFNHYIAKLADIDQLTLLIAQMDAAFDLLERAHYEFESEELANEIISICNTVKNKKNWNEFLSYVLSKFYELKNLLPAFVMVEGLRYDLPLSHPAEIGLIKHEEGEKDGVLRFPHGTSSYINLQSVDTSAPYSLPITNLLQQAAHDLRLPTKKREFIKKLIS